MAAWWPWPAVAVAALAVALAGCRAAPAQEVDFDVIADEEVASVDRSPRAVIPGGEVLVAGAARTAGELGALWELLGLSGRPPALPPGRAAIALAGGEPVDCSWDLRAVERSDDAVGLYLRLANGPDPGCEGRWRARALVLAIPEEDVPDDATPGMFLRLVPDALGYDTWRLGPDGPRRFTPLTATAGATTIPGRSEPAELTEVAISTYPGMDVVHFTFAGTPEITYTVDEVERAFAEELEDVPGESFLRISLAELAAAGPERVPAPPGAVSTELRRLDEEEGTSWILGLAGPTTPISRRAAFFGAPREGLTLSIAVQHVSGRR